MSLRLHAFELEDQPWFPAPVRDLMTDVLRALQLEFGVDDAIAEVLSPVLRETRARQLVDLCSGAGGLLPSVRRALARRGVALNVLFTDRYPNQRALAELCSSEPEALRFCADSIDAADLPSELTGFRTLFTSFHHFRPAQARAILESAQRARAPIAIFEITERSWTACARMALTPLVCWRITPRLRPRTLQRLLLTYVVPIVPLALTWDGMISNLRTYTPHELAALTADLCDGDYAWRIGQLRGRFAQVTTYLIGAPLQPSASVPVELQNPQRMTEKEPQHATL